MGLRPWLPDQIWLHPYPIRYAGCDFDARMAVLRMTDDRLMLHSPCAIDGALEAEIEALGEVAFIVAPGDFHYFHVASAQSAFPDAETWVCPGVERKSPALRFDGVLGEAPHPGWAESLDQVLVEGNRFIREVVFLHRPTRTLVITDLIEHFTDATPNASWLLRLWFKLVFRMWNDPKPAPEYQLGWRDREAARRSLERILAWDFERILLSHGDLVESEAKRVARGAFRGVLGAA